MTEETTPPDEKLSQETLAEMTALKIGGPPFDDLSGHTYREETVSRWTSFAPDQNVVVPLTRNDLDHLFFFFAQTTACIAMLQVALRTLSKSDMTAAELAFQKSVEMRLMADTNFRKFFEAIMDKAQPHG